MANPLADQDATEGAAFSYIVAANAFTDVDAGDTLAYVATRADGSDLPTWLTFDAATRTFSGTPANGDVGTVSLKVTATDLAGASISDTFDLEVNNTNDAPTVENTIADQNAVEDTAFSVTLPANVFADVDTGDSLALTVTPADGSVMPSWLSFDAATRTLSGTPANGDVGTVSLKVTATDLAGASVSDTFGLTVANTNDAPTVANAIADQSAVSAERDHGRVAAGLPQLGADPGAARPPATEHGFGDGADRLGRPERR